MPLFDTVIFDLDGTLTNSEKGITACAAYALEKMGWPVPDREALRKYIGPPLAESFSAYCGMNEEQIERAVGFYRERYLPIGWRENMVYPGIRSLLKTLKEQGVQVFVATGKPQEPSERILRYFRLTQYIDGVAGPTDEEPYGGKKQLIGRVLKEKAYQKAVMIGDRASDITGAQAYGIEAIGAGYGFGEKGEFAGLNCPVAQSVEELSELLLGTPLKCKGYFISMEGLDGCGKTTQSDAVEAALRDFGYQVVHTREPGGCPISEKIRSLLLDASNVGMSGITEALLYAASRAQHVHQVIKPAVTQGKIVLCDRFVDSSIAFQGGGRELGVDLIQEINRPAVADCLPDTTVFLKLDHKTVLSRRKNASIPDRIESEDASFHARVEQAYGVLIQRDPERFITVDANETPEKITEKILSALFDRLDAAEVV